MNCSQYCELLQSEGARHSKRLLGSRAKEQAVKTNPSKSVFIQLLVNIYLILATQGLISAQESPQLTEEHLRRLSIRPVPDKEGLYLLPWIRRQYVRRHCAGPGYRRGRHDRGQHVLL